MVPNLGKIYFWRSSIVFWLILYHALGQADLKSWNVLDRWFFLKISFLAPLSNLKDVSYNTDASKSSIYNSFSFTGKGTKCYFEGIRQAYRGSEFTSSESQVGTEQT